MPKGEARVMKGEWRMLRNASIAMQMCPLAPTGGEGCPQGGGRGLRPTWPLTKSGSATAPQDLTLAPALTLARLGPSVKSKSKSKMKRGGQRASGSRIADFVTRRASAQAVHSEVVGGPGARASARFSGRIRTGAGTFPPTALCGRRSGVHAALRHRPPDAPRPKVHWNAGLFSAFPLG
jgi:hypothetical protein